ncbi:MAG: EamA family transporter RarD [bacterium]|nr:EamA family transporter RarD [bacterium]
MPDATSASSSAATARVGLLYGLVAYGWWAFLFPLHVRALGLVAPADVTAAPVAWSLEILAHRIVWSLLFCLALCRWRGSFGQLFAAIRDRRTLLRLTTCALLVTVNWVVFILAMARGELYRAGIGYFVTPVVQILLGTLLLGERLRPGQWYAVGFAIAGMIALLAIAVVVGGEVPWIEAGLALSFGFYGLVRRGVKVGPVVGLAVETGLLTPFALTWLVLASTVYSLPLAFPAGGAAVSWLLVLTGISTAAPMLCFAAAAIRLPLSTIGFLQFLAPTGQVLLGLVAYGERPADPRLWWGYALIWAGVLILLTDGVRRQLRRQR